METPLPTDISLRRVGLGGGCHWCTEAVFASLKGVQQVQQGWIAAQPPDSIFSEAVIVSYHPAIISLKDLIEIHLHTHAATANHSMRHKYRSAVYYFTGEDQQEAAAILEQLQAGFDAPLITQLLPYAAFKSSVPGQLNYYYSNPEKPFCKLYIHPKLQLLKKQFGELANEVHTGE